MSFTHKLIRTWQDSAGRQVSAAVMKVGEGEDNRTLTLAASETRVEVLGIASAGLKVLYLLATRSVFLDFRDVTGSGISTIALAPNVPFVWTEDDAPQIGNPFGEPPQDVVSVELTNNDTVNAAKVEIRVLQDS